MSDWNLNGTYFESCNCEVACPCVFLSPPTDGECTVLVAWHIEDGSDGDVELNDLNVALAVHSPGHMAQVKWKAAIYLDDRASEQQRESLLKIYGGQAGGVPAVLASFIDEMLGAKSAPIQYVAEGRKRSLLIAGIADTEIAAIDGQEGNDVTIQNHPLALAPGFPVVASKSSRLSFEDYGMKWALSGKNGFYAPFHYHSG